MKNAKDSTPAQPSPGPGPKKAVARKTAPANRAVHGAPVKSVKPAAATLRTDAPATSEPQRPKPKLVRDSFTIPKSEYAVLDALKERAARLMRPTKKSEVLRAGITALNAMSDKAFLNMLKAVPALKTGRPKSATPAAAPARPPLK